jgi:SanA protein
MKLRGVRRGFKIALGVALVPWLCAALLLGVSQSLVGRERRLVHRDLAGVPARTVAIVPGAQVWPEGQPSSILRDRLQAALELYRAGKVRRILVSGDHAQPGYDEVNVMRRWLRDRGVPDEAIFMDHAGLRTNDTMQRAARVFEVRDAIVCTQAFHLPRALYLARHAGIDAVGFVADRQVDPQASADRTRELLATALAVVDVALGRGPRFLGPKVPIAGDAAATHDAATRE